MQDYKLFIAEINRLDVKTKQLFVKDGIVLEEQYNNPIWYKEEPEERWPGYLSTFYNFDKYNADGEQNLYEAHLAKLREEALIDLMVLGTDQLSRFVNDLKAKRDRMNRLLKLAKALDKEYLYQKFEDALSLEHNLFEAFNIAQPLNVSLEPASARYLMHAVAVKRNQLVSIVNQIEQALNPDPSEDGTHEKGPVENLDLPNLYIQHESRQILYDRLKPFIRPDAEDKHTALYNLIFHDQVPEVPMLVIGIIKEFGLTFHTSGAVPPQGAKVLSEQLSKYFNQTNGQDTWPLSADYLARLIRDGKREDEKNKAKNINNP